MEKSNVKKGSYNVLFGILSQVITILIGIVTPRLFLVNYGSEMNGLLNSVSQIYVYMGLLEAGMGTITLQALYKPVGLGDRSAINGIMAAADRYYKKIGFIYILLVGALSFGYPLIVNTTIPFFKVAGIVFMSGISGAIAFYFQAKYKLLLYAEGKHYILTNIGLIAHIVLSVVKIGLLLAGLDVLMIQLSHMIINMLQVIYIVFYFRRHYGWIDLKVKPNQQSLEQRGSAFIHQLSDMIFRNTDVLVLTLIPTCGLLTVSVYTMYNMFLTMIQSAINSVFSGVEFILGQTFDVDRKKYIKLHDAYEVYGMALIFSLFTVAYIFISPFLALYTSGVEDVSYVDQWLPLLFALSLLLSAGRRASAGAINYAKHFRKTQGRAIAEASINIIVSIPCAYYFGIYGALLGTIAALLYRTNDMIIYANRVVLERSCFATYKRWLVNLALFAAIAVGVRYMPWELNSYIKLILWACATCLVVIPLFFVVASVLNMDVFRDACEFIKERFGKKKHKA